MPTSPATDRRQRSAERARRRDRGGGFALIELMLALAIISLLAALALPSARFGSGSGMMRFEAQRIAAFLRSDRNAALRSGRPVLTLVDLPRRRLESGSAATTIEMSPGLAFASQPRDLRGVRFSADGRSTGGAILLGARGSGLRVSVNPQTAAVQVEEF